MEINEYYYFYEVCKQEGFSAAAKVLFVTQPAVSYAVSKLEDKIGVELIDRKSKKLKLTLYGEELYNDLCDIFENLIQVDKKIEHWKYGKLKIINIAVPEHIASILILDKVIEFTKKYPNAKINIITGSSKYLLDVFLKGEADILIDCMPIDFSKLRKFEKSAFARQHFVLFTDKSNNVDKLTKKKMCNYKFILPSKNTNCTSALLDIVDRESININVQSFVATTDLLKKFVENSDYIGYAMENEISDSDNLKILSTDLELPYYDIYKIYSPYCDNLVLEFLNLL